jgi:hypothetical protein
VSHQDQARWADKQRQEAQSQLDIALAGRTESWKAKLWARKLEQLKVRNDAIADTLDLARRRIKKLEDQRQGAELKVELSEVGGCRLRSWLQVASCTGMAPGCCDWTCGTAHVAATWHSTGTNRGPCGRCVRRTWVRSCRRA